MILRALFLAAGLCVAGPALAADFATCLLDKLPRGGEERTGPRCRAARAPIRLRTAEPSAILGCQPITCRAAERRWQVMPRFWVSLGVSEKFLAPHAQWNSGSEGWISASSL
jgi:hypothetical protein